MDVGDPARRTKNPYRPRRHHEELQGISKNVPRGPGGDIGGVTAAQGRLD